MLVRVEINTEYVWNDTHKKRKLMNHLMDAVSAFSKEEQLLIKRVSLVEPKPKKRKA